MSSQATQHGNASERGKPCILPNGFAEALQGLYPGGHRRIAVPTQTFYDDVQHTRWLSLLLRQHSRRRQLEQHYLDGLYVKVWIEQLQVPTDDSRIIQYDYRPLVDDAVHTQAVLRLMQECGTLGCNRRPPGCTHTAPISRLFRLGQSINRKCWFSWRDGGQGCTAPSLPLATSQAAAGDVVYPNCWS